MSRPVLARSPAPRAQRPVRRARQRRGRPNSCDIVVLDGQLDHDRLRAAIARHPSGAGIRLLRGRSRFAPSLPFTAGRRRRRHRSTPTSSGAASGASRCPRTAAPVRFHVTETPPRTYLQTIHTHVYADATACYMLTEQIVAGYAHATPDAGSTSRRGAGRSAPTSSATRVATRRRRSRTSAGRRTDAARPRRRLAGLAARRGPRPAAAAGALPFTPRETERSAAAARARGYSIHAFFQLSFLRAAMDYNRRPRGRATAPATVGLLLGAPAARGGARATTAWR